jgi:hypothetical protein
MGITWPDPDLDVQGFAERRALPSATRALPSKCSLPSAGSALPCKVSLCRAPMHGKVFFLSFWHLISFI